MGICFGKFAHVLCGYITTLGNNNSPNIVNGLNNSDGLRRGKGKVKITLSSLGLRPVKRTMNRTIGVSRKSHLTLLAG